SHSRSGDFLFDLLISPRYRPLIEQRRAHNPCFILQLGWHHFGLHAQQRNEFFMLLADASTNDEQIGPEKFFHGHEISVQPFGIFLPRKIIALTGRVGGTMLGVPAFDLNVTKFGIWQQLTIVKNCRANAGAEREDNDRASEAFPRPKLHLSQASYISIIPDLTWATGYSGEQLICIDTDPLL